MVERLFRLLFWLAVVVCFVMAVIPQPVEMAPSDKWQHAAAFATLTALAMMAYRSWSPLRLLLGLGAFGGLIEIVQSLDFVGRDGDWKDWAVDLIAVIAVLALGWVGQSFFKKSSIRI